MFLTGPDEFSNHQVAFPHFMVGVSDPNWRERYWFSVQDVVTRDFILSCGFGKYPNKNVMEGFVIAQQGSRQWNLRVARQLLPASDRISVGPLSLEIVEPFRTLRLRLEENPSGMALDLSWHGELAPMLEKKHFEINHARVTHDIIRYVQLGRVEGAVRIPGNHINLTLDSGWGERDHSWGIRPMNPAPGDPPVASAEWNFLAFCPLQFEDFAVHLYLFEAQEGKPSHVSASLVRRDGTGEAFSAVSHDFEWDYQAAVRTLVAGTLTLHRDSGPSLTICLVALAPRVYLRGGGYGLDQGHWKGELSIEHETWDLSSGDTLRKYVQGSSDHMVEALCGGETGFGIIEYVVRRGHSKYARPGGIGR